MKIAIFKVFIAIMLVCLGAVSVKADNTDNWKGGTGTTYGTTTSWANTANWSLNAVPTTADLAYMPGTMAEPKVSYTYIGDGTNAYAAISANVYVGSNNTPPYHATSTLYIQNHGSLTLTDVGGLFIGNAQSINVGTVNIANGGTFTGHGINVGYTGTGTLNVYGAVNVNIGTSPVLNVAYNPDSNGTVNVYAGGVITASSFSLARSSTGTLNMKGGAVTVTGILTVAPQAGSSGHIQLDGGTLSIRTLTLNNDVNGSRISSINITRGTLRVNGDANTTIQNYKQQGLITAYSNSPTDKLIIQHDNVNNQTVVTAEQTAGKAGSPYPADAATKADLSIHLKWSAGAYIAMTGGHDVYFGTDYSSVANANHSSQVFKGTVDQNSIKISGLLPGTTYYWAVDEVNQSNIWKGSVWSFTTLDIPDIATNQYLNDDGITVSWKPGSDVDTHDVYLGTTYSDVNQAQCPPADIDRNGRVDFGDICKLAQVWQKDAIGEYHSPYVDFDKNGNVDFADLAFVTNQWLDQAGESFRGTFDANSYTLPVLMPDTTYYWRVDERNYIGVRKGEVQSFITVGSTPAKAYSWNGGGSDSNWTNANNWSQDTLPTAFYAAILDQSSKTVIVGRHNLNDIDVTAKAIRMADANSDITLTINRLGIINCVDGWYVGYGSGLSHAATVNAEGGCAVYGSDLYIGYNGKGTWNQKTLEDSGMGYPDAVSEFTGTVYVGYNSDSNGTLAASGGIMRMAKLVVGENGRGILTVSSTAHAAGRIYISGILDVTSGGYVNLTDGVVTASDLHLAAGSGYLMSISSGVLVTDGNDVPTIQGYINAGRIKNTNSPTGNITAEYDSVSNKTTLRASMNNDTRTWEGGDHRADNISWADPLNWSGNVRPDSNEYAHVDDGVAEMYANERAKVSRLYIGHRGGVGQLTIHNLGRLNVGNAYIGNSGNGKGTLIIESGAAFSCSSAILGYDDSAGPIVGEWQQAGTTTFTDSAAPNLTIGYDANSEGTLTVSDGTMSGIKYLYVGRSGHGTLNISGGTVTASSTLYVAQNGGSTGHIQLDGGTINANNLTMTSGGLILITGGQLVLTGDRTSTVSTYYNNGWITVPPNYNFSNVYSGGKTTVKAIHNKALLPSPAHQAICVDRDGNGRVTLSWAAGEGVTSHDVYFGTTSPGAFQGNQIAATFTTAALDANTTYYWRIDEHGASTTIGDVWSFTTRDAKASQPSIADGNSNIDIMIKTISWSKGAGAVSHDVYFGKTSPGTFKVNQTSTSYTISEPNVFLEPGTTYYWRIDEVDSNGTRTAGDVWHFTTKSYPGNFVAYDATNKYMLNLATGTITKNGGKTTYDCTADNLQVHAEFTQNANCMTVDGYLYNNNHDDRGVILQYILPHLTTNNAFSTNINYSTKLTKYTDLEDNALPIAAVSSPGYGRAVAIPPNAPSIFGVTGDVNEFGVKFYLGMAPDANTANKAAFKCIVYFVDPNWGFRNALEKYYSFYPDYYVIPRATDYDDGFSIMNQSGENAGNPPGHIPNLDEVGTDRVGLGTTVANFNLTRDAAYNINSFFVYNIGNLQIKNISDAYVPNWPNVTLEQMNFLLNQQSADFKNQVETSCCRDYTGSNYLFIPWDWTGVSNHTISFVLNPNPALNVNSIGQVTINASVALFNNPSYTNPVDGVMTDSQGAGWPGHFDFSRTHFAKNKYPLTFDPNGKVCIHNTLAHYECLEQLRNTYHSYTPHKWLLMNGIGAYNSNTNDIGNEPEFYYRGATLGRFFAGALADWVTIDNGTASSQYDYEWGRMAFGPKQYHLINPKWYNQDAVIGWLNKSLLYGMFASSTDGYAQTQGGSNEDYYDSPMGWTRDHNDLTWFITNCRKILAAGWEPATYATASPAAGVFVERYGKGDSLTDLNNTKAYFVVYSTYRNPDQTIQLTLDTGKLGYTGQTHTFSEIARGSSLSGSSWPMIQLNHIEPFKAYIIEVTRTQ